jgi:hypothetical protein
MPRIAPTEYEDPFVEPPSQVTVVLPTLADAQPVEHGSMCLWGIGSLLLISVGTIAGNPVLLCATEGILPALESSHALAGAKRWAANNAGARILIGLSGRGDKDMPILAKYPMADERSHAAA